MMAEGAIVVGAGPSEVSNNTGYGSPVESYRCLTTGGFGGVEGSSVLSSREFPCDCKRPRG